jgi:hypothetical protein
MKQQYHHRLLREILQPALKQINNLSKNREKKLNSRKQVRRFVQMIYEDLFFRWQVGEAKKLD